MNSTLKTVLTSTAILKPVSCIIIFFRGIIKQELYPLKLTRRSKNGMKHINEFPNLSLKKSITDMAATVNDPINIFIDSYINKNVKKVKLAQVNLSKTDPVLICIVKNDLFKIKKQIEYHRNIGIRHFAYLDNESGDGTFEYLYEQDDVSLFTVSESFTELRKLAWRKQVMDIIGYGNWYLILDADEIFMYPGIEEKRIDKFVDFLESKKIEACFTLVVDMYTNKEIFGNETDDHIRDYCFFDTASYSVFNSYSCQFIYGGPRARVFRYSPQLATYRLVKMSRDKIAGTHNNYPNSINTKAKHVTGFILHYKTFGKKELEKYAEYIKTEIHANNSGEYKRFLEVYNMKPNAMFYHNDSEKLDSSMDLLKIKIADKVFLNDFLNT